MITRIRIMDCLGEQALCWCGCLDWCEAVLGLWMSCSAKPDWWFWITLWENMKVVYPCQIIALYFIPLFKNWVLVTANTRPSRDLNVLNSPWKVESYQPLNRRLKWIYLIIKRPSRVGAWFGQCALSYIVLYRRSNPIRLCSKDPPAPSPIIIIRLQDFT